jgi:hypothetical protein
VTVSPYNKTSDVFSPEYKANTSRRIDFSADVITNTSSNIRLYTAFAMHIVGICPNITQFTVLMQCRSFVSAVPGKLGNRRINELSFRFRVGSLIFCSGTFSSVPFVKK